MSTAEELFGPRKYCPSCSQFKMHEEFHVDRSSQDGRLYKCKACRNAENRKNYAPNKPARRRATYLRRYGLAIEDYEAMLAQQEGRCAICRTTEPGGRWGEFFCVDHDHQTDEVRGLLCRHCNIGLGHFMDEPQRLEAAAAYLRGGA